MNEAASPPPSTLVAAVLDRYRPPVLAAMRRALDRPGSDHVRLMRYHLGWEDGQGNAIDGAAGKMLRPALCLLCCEALGGSIEAALPAAAAIELLHNFTLIHDDIEDRSETRHGRPTLWTVVGVEKAINAGDGLFAIAQRTLLDLVGAGHPPERVIEASRRLSEVCVLLCEGQHADIGFEQQEVVSRAEYEAMIEGKTAALLSASAALGALCAGAPQLTVSEFARYGLVLGLAFQLQDDALGVWGEAIRTGKSASDDIRSRKKSFPIVYAMEHLRGEALEAFRRRYAAPSEGDADVAAVLHLLDLAGAREASENAARARVAEALEAVAGMSLSLDHRAELEALASFAVERNA